MPHSKPFIHQIVLETLSMPGTVLGAEDTTRNKVPVLMEFVF